MNSFENNLELETLQKFTKKVADLNLDEETCRRFLVAREFDIQAAETMIRNNVKWRKEMNVNYLMNEWICEQDMQDEFKYAWIGRCFNGAPAIWVQAGVWSVRSYVEAGRSNEVIQHCARSLEQALVEIDKCDGKRLVAIYDYEEFTYWKIAHYETNRVIYSMFKMLEENYPEILDKVVIVNAPYALYIGWNILKPLLSERTTAKIQIFGSDKTKYLPVIRQLMSDEVIPRKYLV